MSLVSKAALAEGSFLLVPCDNVVANNNPRVAVATFPSQINDKISTIFL